MDIEILENKSEVAGVIYQLLSNSFQSFVLERFIISSSDFLIMNNLKVCRLCLHFTSHEN